MTEVATTTSIDVLQYFMDISDSSTPAYERVTEDTAFDPKTEREAYSPKYKCNKVQPEYAAGKKNTIDVNIDIAKEKPLGKWLIKHEDDDDVLTSVIRVWTDGADNTALEAKKADFLWNSDPLDGDANNPIHATGKLAMVSDGWTVGTFDMTTKTFEIG